MFVPGPNSTPDVERAALPTLDSDDGATPAAETTTPGRPSAGPGQQLGRYRTLRVLGQGGAGVVYTAYDQLLDRVVALKTVRTDRSTSTDVGRFIREAKALARLSHPNVVAIHDVSIAGGQVFLAMELVRGRTLRQHLKETREANHARVVALFIAAGHGLAAAHRAGLIHRDFKPKTRSLLGRPPFSPSGRILKNRGVSRQGPWRMVPLDAAGLATGWQRFRAARGAPHSGLTQTSANAHASVESGLRHRSPSNMTTTATLTTLESFDLEAAERHLCTLALDAAGNIVEAAKLLGVTRHALKRRIIKHKIVWPRPVKSTS